MSATTPAALRILSGTGNRFALYDAITHAAPRDPAALARALCGDDARGPKLDGLLLVLPARAGGDVRMQLHNADGSAAETCGNGLRCVAKLAYEARLVVGRDFVIEDTAGLHVARVEPASGPVAAATVSMGRPRILARRERIELAHETIELAPGSIEGARVDVGNPHFVVLVDDVARAPVRTDGARAEKNAAFPAGTNVEFVARTSDPSRWDVRVWERGVGETEACGSGACAVAVALEDAGLAALPVELRLPGGVLTIARDASGAVTLSGAIDDLGERALPKPVATT